MTLALVHRCSLVGCLLLATLGCKPPPLEERIAKAEREDANADAVRFAFPLRGTVVPPGLPPPLLSWRDDVKGSDTWLVEVVLSGVSTPLRAAVHAPSWRPPEATWQQIKAASSDQPARITVLGVHGLAPEKVLSVGQTTVATSSDPVKGSLLYREVNLPFIEAVKDPSKIRWRFGAATARTPPPVVLTGLPVCGNCHSFSADGSTLGMDVDYANDKGSYAIADTATRTVIGTEQVISWSDYKREDGKPTFGLLSQVSPDGRYVISTVKDRSVFVARPDLAYSQLFFPVKGILAVYDREKKTFAALPGADDPTFVQSNPTWSPDGKFVVFARAKAHKLGVGHDNVLLSSEETAAFLKGGRTFRFDLYCVPFNGGQGGDAEPLPGASHNERSNFFPRFTPDGRFIVFTQADSFMLLQPDSALYIMPAKGGHPRRMTCNTDNMNSWHSFSPDGRWMVFSSKAMGPYTRMFLTHIDADGRDTPAVPLERLNSPKYAANIPEFVNLPPDAITDITENFVTDLSYMRAGGENMRLGDLRRAEQRYRDALRANPNNADGHKNLGTVLARTGRPAEAVKSFRRLLELRPGDADGHLNLGNALAVQDRLKEALPHLEKGLKGRPDDAHGRLAIAHVLLGLKRTAEARVHIAEAVRLDADSKHARALVLRAGGLAGAAAPPRPATATGTARSPVSSGSSAGVAVP